MMKRVIKLSLVAIFLMPLVAAANDTAVNSAASVSDLNNDVQAQAVLALLNDGKISKEVAKTIVENPELAEQLTRVFAKERTAEKKGWRSNGAIIGGCIAVCVAVIAGGAFIRDRQFKKSQTGQAQVGSGGGGAQVSTDASKTEGSVKSQAEVNGNGTSASAHADAGVPVSADTTPLVEKKGRKRTASGKGASDKKLPGYARPEAPPSPETTAGNTRSRTPNLVEAAKVDAPLSTVPV